MLVHDFMGSNALQFKQRTVIIKTKFFIKWKRFGSGVEPHKVASFLSQKLDSMCEKFLSKPLTSIFFLRGHSSQAIGEACGKIWMRFQQKSGDRNQVVAMKKTEVIRRH